MKLADGTYESGGLEYIDTEEVERLELSLIKSGV